MQTNEQRSALTEAFPLIAAGVLVVIGVVLFVTVLWPESGTRDRTAPRKSAPAAPREASPPPVSAPSPATVPPTASPAPEVTAPVAESTTPPASPETTQSPGPAVKPEPTAVAQTAAAPKAADAPERVKPAPAPAAVSPDVKSMVDAALSGDDAQVRSIAKQLGSQRTQGGNRSRARDLNRKALALVQKGRYPDAIALLEEAHRAAPGDAEISENLGYALLKAGRSDDAEPALLSALESGPQRASAWGSLGFVYAKRGQHTEAVKLILTAYGFAPDRKKAAEIYRRQAKADADPKVRAMLEDALRQLPR